MRLHTSTDGEDGGSGLGLAICRSIVGLHQGQISAESGPDETGLRIVFELPRQVMANIFVMRLGVLRVTLSK